MNFAFGKNDEPLDLTKGGDAGSVSNKPPMPSTSGAIPKIVTPMEEPVPETSQPNTPVAAQRKAPQLPPPTLAVPPRRTITPPPVYSPPASMAKRPESSTQEEREGQQYPQDQQYQTPAPRNAQPETHYTTDNYGSPTVSSDNYDTQPENNYNQGYRQEPPTNQQPSQIQDLRQAGPAASYNNQPPKQEYNSPNNAGVNQAQQQPQQQIQMVDRKGRPVTPKVAKAAKSKPVKDPNKRSSYTGDRRKVLLARIAVFGILGILVLAGLSSFIPKASGLSASDGPLIIQKVKENLGITDFPATTGEGIALGFSKVYLGYNPTDRDTRYNLLLGYAPESILTSIDPSIASQVQLAAAAESPEATPADPEAPATEVPVEPVAVVPTGIQSVTDGPYLVRTVMIQGGESAIFTTKTQVNNKTWIYMEIPMLYNAENNTVTVSGSPTFVRPIGTSSVPANQYTPKWNNDDTVVTAMDDDMTNYMRAWGAGNESTLDRFVVKDGGKVLSTPEAYQGLDGTVRLVSVNEFTVELKPALEDSATSADRADFYTRDALTTVSWLESGSGLVYSQTYQLELKYVNNGWFIQDIHSSAIGTNEYKDKL